MAVTAFAPTFSDEIVGLLDAFAHKPEIYNEIYNARGDQGGEFFRFLMSAGFSEPVAQNTYYWAEQDIISPTFSPRADVGAPGTNTAQLITLDTGSVNAQNRYFPGVNDDVWYPNGNTGHITAIDVTTPSAPVLTITPHVAAASGALPAVTTSTVLSIHTNSWYEASGQPRGRVTDFTTQSNDLQIIKASIDRTGVEMTNQSWYKINGIANAPYCTTGTADTEYRMDLLRDGALLFGQRTTATILDADGYPLKTTQGLIPVITERGMVPTPYTTGTLAMSDFYAWIRLLQTQFAGKNIFFGTSQDLQFQLETLLVNQFKDTNISYGRKAITSAVFGGNESLALSVNFKSLFIGERNFMFKSLGALDNPQTYATTGSIAKGMGVIIPLAEKKDTLTGKMFSNIGYRYKAFGAYNRKMEIWDVNGAGPGLKVTEYDKNSHYMRSNIGGQVMGANQMILLKSA